MAPTPQFNPKNTIALPDCLTFPPLGLRISLLMAKKVLDGIAFLSGLVVVATTGLTRVGALNQRIGLLLGRPVHDLEKGPSE